ncbi:hypothetical protein FRC04_009380 [Tulasnella sp. 424]|nr:hypothetical protein FRC04_009380 [Tulasnella sp. 424]
MHPFATITRFRLFLWLALGAFLFSQAQAAPLGSSATSTGTAPRSSPTFICLKKARDVAGAFIVAATNGTAVSGLQVNDDLNTATLAKEGYIGAWTFNGGVVGAWDYCTYRYLTVDFSGKLSYKPMCHLELLENNDVVDCILRVAAKDSSPVDRGRIEPTYPVTVPCV